MTLDAEDIEAIATAVAQKLSGKVPQQKPLTPGSFPARRQAALNALNKKLGVKI